MAHIHELIDFVVAVYIVYHEKVLLVDHKKLKAWMPIGGHIELNEDPIEALMREIQEECGLGVEIIGGLKADVKSSTAKPLAAPLYMDIHNITDQHRHIGLVYFAKANSDVVALAEQEHHSFRWFTKEELNDASFTIRPLIRFYCEEALKKLAE